MKYVPIIIVICVLLGLIFFRILNYIGKKQIAGYEEGEKEILKKPMWKIRAGDKEDTNE